MTNAQSILACIKMQPAIKVAVVGQCDNELFSVLHKALEEVGGELVTFMYDKEPMALPSMTINMIDNYAKGFRAVAREYAMVVLNHHYRKVENKERLLKATFKSILNAGELMIIEDDLCDIEYILQENGFVAINEIPAEGDGLLLSAKKMHGWGHGL